MSPLARSLGRALGSRSSLRPCAGTLWGCAARARAPLCSSASEKPALRGVVFDLDGTLTVPNLDFAEMYRRCGVDRRLDILREIAAMPPHRAREATAVVDEMEAEGRRTLQLINGAVACAQWLASRRIPMALVTRNTQETVKHFHARLWEPQGLPPLSPALSRDGVVGASDSPLSELPAKPDPAAMFAIAKVWGVPVGPGLVMVGDSPSNDVAFGKAAGVSTVLLDSSRKHEEGLGPNTPDLHVQSLAELPHLFAEHFRL
mmetsp:Transcript_29475/g.82332  ORF Transcript_29475/g.82332 Transcript_29475/m.82332 type:complete len:260 (-) Transcript_29475:101-880(-)